MEWILLYLLFSSIFGIWLLFCIGVYYRRLASAVERRDAAIQCDCEDTISECESEGNVDDILSIRCVTGDKKVCFSFAKIPVNVEIKYNFLDAKCRAEVGGEHERAKIMCNNCHFADNVSRICNSDCEHVGLRIGDDTVVFRHTGNELPNILHIDTSDTNHIKENENVAKDTCKNDVSKDSDKIDTVEDDKVKDPNSGDDTCENVSEDNMSGIVNVENDCVAKDTCEINVSKYSDKTDTVENDKVKEKAEDPNSGKDTSENVSGDKMSGIVNGVNDSVAKDTCEINVSKYSDKTDTVENDKVKEKVEDPNSGKDTSENVSGDNMSGIVNGVNDSVAKDMCEINVSKYSDKTGTVENDKVKEKVEDPNSGEDTSEKVSKDNMNGIVNGVNHSVANDTCVNDVSKYSDNTGTLEHDKTVKEKVKDPNSGKDTSENVSGGNRNGIVNGENDGDHCNGDDNIVSSKHNTANGGSRVSRS